MRRTLSFAALLVIASIITSGCVVSGGTRSGSGGGFFFLLLPLVFIVVVARLLRSLGGRPGRRRAASARHDTSACPTPAMLQAELSVLSDDVLRLEPLVSINEAARNDYEAALHRFRVAGAALADVDSPVDLARVQRVVDEATWSMARVRAILDGRPLPPPPSALQRPGRAGEPAVHVDDLENPEYVGSPMTFRSGWFAGGGLLGGLLLGTVFGANGEWEPDDARNGDGRHDAGNGVGYDDPVS